MARTASSRWCYVLMGVALIVLTFGNGYEYWFGEKFADFYVIAAGLFVGWVAFFYCVGNHVALSD